MTTRRVAIAAAVVAAIALAGAVTFAALRSQSSGRSSGSSSTTTTTTMPPPLTTVAPQTIPVPPLPPAGPMTAPPPAVTVPPGTPRTAPPVTTPGGTTSPTVTAAPATTTTSTTKPPTGTTKPATSTTKPGRVTRKTVVYTPTGTPQRGDLVIPRQHQDTIIVLVHGGDGSTGSRKQMRGWSSFYAAHGYASFAIDYLLVKPSTPSPVYPKPENDVKAAVQYLRMNADQLGINADRIVVQGFSAGAALGAQALVRDAPAAFIGFSGLYDGTQLNPTHYYGGPPDSSDPKVKERYANANSIAQAASAAGPASLYAAEDDAAATQSATSFRDALQSAGKDVTLTPTPAAGGTFDEETAPQVLDWLQARFPPS
jgi:acetyl esterase/lipase